MSITQMVSTIHLKDTVTFTLHSQFLNHNFQVVAQCLLKIKDLQNIVFNQKQNSKSLQQKMKIFEEKLNKNIDNTYENEIMIKQLKNNIGDEFMKKMYKIQQKTKNMFDFDETLQKIQKSHKFTLTEEYNNKNIEIQEQINKLLKIKNEFERFVDNNSFNQYKINQNLIISSQQIHINQLKEQINKYSTELSKIRSNIKDIGDQIKQNQVMMKEINFVDIMEKMKKFQDDTSSKVGQLTSKMKKKVNQNELLAMEKIMIDKLDKFLAQTQQSKAEKSQTKEAFLFLERKLVELDQIVQKKLLEQDNGLFTSKKVQCASCTKDLGKYEGKLGQYHPWSVFPCKQLDPEKSGGFGYLSYIDKTAYKRGIDTQDQNLQRLNKTIQDPKQFSRKKASTHRGFNLIHNFGSQQKQHSLKESYYKDITTRAGSSNNKTFRVTKKQNIKQNDEIISKQL